MTREEAKELLPLIKAHAEGKTIEERDNHGDWKEAKNPILVDSLVYSWARYRVKPEPKYRPFNTQEECWNEMQKHQPFGWVKYKETGTYIMISTVYSSTTNPPRVSIDCCEYPFSDTFDNFYFADGTPFGINED